MKELKEQDPVSSEPEPLLEEEDDQPTFLVIAQFFLIPLMIISVCVGLFFLFGRDRRVFLASARCSLSTAEASAAGGSASCCRTSARWPTTSR